MTINSNQILYGFDTSVGESAGTRNDYYKLVMQFIGATTPTTKDHVNLSYANKRTIAATGTPDLVDLVAGNVYAGNSGTAISLLQLNHVVVINVNTTQILTVGGSGHTISTMFTGTNPGIILPPAFLTTASILMPSFFVLNSATGFGVTSSSADVLRVATNGGTNIDYYLLLLGRTVAL